jgi:hypothetical protein
MNEVVHSILEFQKAAEPPRQSVFPLIVTRVAQYPPEKPVFDSIARMALAGFSIDAPLPRTHPARQVAGILFSIQLQAEILSAQIQSIARCELIGSRAHSGL